MENIQTAILYVIGNIINRILLQVTNIVRIYMKFSILLVSSKNKHRTKTQYGFKFQYHLYLRKQRAALQKKKQK